MITKHKNKNMVNRKMKEVLILKIELDLKRNLQIQKHTEIYSYDLKSCLSFLSIKLQNGLTAYFIRHSITKVPNTDAETPSARNAVYN